MEQTNRPKFKTENVEKIMCYLKIFLAGHNLYTCTYPHISFFFFQAPILLKVQGRLKENTGQTWLEMFEGYLVLSSPAKSPTYLLDGDLPGPSCSKGG